ncbi:MAG: hypothetical protein ACK5IM_04105, partial [Demequina sp.]|uniref:hypothetical protein n=1 Tax=Demequina sp. TaxID=2050685 RepID=UPI003A88EB6C
MTATARRERRPFSVVALVTLTFLAGTLDVALGAGLTAVGSGALAAVASNTTTLGVGVGLAVVGLAQLAVAVGLLRRSTNARVLLTVVEVLRLLTVAYDVLGHESLPVSAWLAPLAGSAGVLVLAWVAPTRRWFETEADRRLARAMASSPRSPWRRGGELLAQAVVLALTVWWTPGVGADAWFAVPLAAVAVALVSWALQPLLTGIAARFGWLGALATALLGYFAILGVALWVAPGIVVASPGWAFVASWIFAALMAAVTWAFSLGTDEYLLTHVARQALSDAPAAPSDGARGVIMVQLD